MKTASKTADRAKIFTSGNSQAIRLPKKFRLPGHSAHIRRRGRSLIITPEEDVWTRFERGLKGLSVLLHDFRREQPPEPQTRPPIFP
jgi:antitoxin VapB